MAEPVSVYVETFGTEYQDKRFIEQYVRDSYKNKKPLCSFITRTIGILFPITQLITPHRGIFL